MNFLLHRHLATQDLGSEIAGFGSMLPDVWRMAHRSMRPRSMRPRSMRARSTRARPTARSLESLDEATLDLLRGIEHHLAADEVFHRDQVFVEGERRLAERFRSAKIEAEKIVLFAHIAWELCLDGALLLRAGVEPTLAALRSGLDAARGGPLAQAARVHQDVDGDPRLAGFDARLEELLEHIAWSDWVPGYGDGDGLAARLAGVRRRTRLPPFATEDLERISACLGSALDDAVPALDRFLAAWRPLRPEEDGAPPVVA